MDPLALVGRRSLLRFALASPLWLAARPVDALEFLVTGLAKAGMGEDPRALIERASEAQHVFDFEPVARNKLLPPHWTFLSQGVHDEFTLRANREAFARFQLSGGHGAFHLVDDLPVKRHAAFQIELKLDGHFQFTPDIVPVVYCLS